MAKRSIKTRDATKMTQAEEVEGWRSLNTFLSYWRVCGSNACKRARGCAEDDPQACLLRLWPVTPERIRFEIRSTIVALNKGLSAEEATRKVKADMARMADHIAAVEVEQFGALLFPLPVNRGEGAERSEAGEGH